MSFAIPIVLAEAASSEATREQSLGKLMSLDLGMSPREWYLLAEYYGLRAALVIVLLTLAWTLAGWLTSVVKSSLLRLKFDETLTLFLAKLTWWGVMGLAALACLSKFGVETTSFAAMIGAGGLAIGLAFQGTLSNFAAGAMLLIFRPYKVGDSVNIAGYTGKVAEIELFTTSIDTADNRRVIIPNGSIFGAVIENISYNRQRRIDVAIGLSYKADIDQSRQLLLETVRSVPNVLLEPAAAVTLKELGPASVDWSVGVWCRSSDSSQVRQDLLRAIKYRLEGAGIALPCPRMDIHLRTDEATVPGIARAA